MTESKITPLLSNFDFVKHVNENSVSGQITGKDGTVCENLFVFNSDKLFKFADAISAHVQDELWLRIKERQL